MMLWGVDHDVDTVGGDVEEPARFDDFEPLVRHRRRIDRDLRAHAPIGMLESLGERDVFQVGERRVAEGAA